MTDHLRRNANLVDMLGGALRDGGHALGAVPGLLKQLLAEGGWREFVTQRGEHVEHDRFEDFVTTPPLKGLGANVEMVRRLVASDIEALDLLDRALAGKQGERTDLVSNIHEVVRPAGTTRDRALRKLRADAPELHAEVLAGRLTAHAAMVTAGFRPKTFTLRADDVASAARTLRKHLSPDQLRELARLLDTQEATA